MPDTDDHMLSQGTVDERNEARNPLNAMPPRTASYRLWVNKERTTLVRVWDSGICEVATRGATWETWGPPVYLHEEKT